MKKSMRFISRFFGALFWRGNSKAGALFGVLLAVFTLTVWMPGGFAAAMVFSKRACACGLAESCYQWLLKGMLFTWFGLLVYTPALMLCFAFDIACKLREARFRIPGKIKSKALAGGACMAAGIGLSVLAWFWMRGDWEKYAWFSIVLFSACAGWVLGIYFLPWPKHAGKWAFSPLVLAALTQWAPMLMLPLQNKPMERAISKLSRAAGSTFSWDVFLEAYTNGVPMREEEPYATFFSRKEVMPYSYSEIMNYNRMGSWAHLEAITEKEKNKFEEFKINFASRVSLLDEITGKPIPRLRHRAGEHPMEIEYYEYYEMMCWARFYMLRMRHAAAEGDMEDVMDAYRRIQRIQTYAREQWPTPNGLLYYAEAEKIAGNGLCGTMAELPVETLEMLQAELDFDNETMLPLNEACVFDFAKLVSTMSLPEWRDLPFDYHWKWGRGRGTASRYMAHFAPFFHMIVRREVERVILNVAVLFEQTPPSTRTLREFCAAMRKAGGGYNPMAWWGESCCDSLAYMVCGELRRIERGQLLATAVAVERYRRANGKLPNCLDELVPEFLMAVPLSLEDGNPVVYGNGCFKPDKYAKIVVDGFYFAGSWYKEIYLESETNRTIVVVGVARPEETGE